MNAYSTYPVKEHHLTIPNLLFYFKEAADQSWGAGIHRFHWRQGVRLFQGILQTFYIVLYLRSTRNRNPWLNFLFHPKISTWVVQKKCHPCNCGVKPVSQQLRQFESQIVWLQLEQPNHITYELVDYEYPGLCAFLSKCILRIQRDEICKTFTLLTSLPLPPPHHR